MCRSGAAVDGSECVAAVSGKSGTTVSVSSAAATERSQVED